MKSILKLIKKFFRFIYRIIDKLIVTPISRVIYGISEYLKNHSIRLDYILNRPHFMVYVSLILAVIMFLLIDSRVITFVESEAEILPKIPVKVNYNEEAYVVEGIPEAVDIVLIGRKSDIYLAKQLGNNSVILDLTDYEARDSAYKVYLSYTKSIDSISYKLDPSYVSVTIKDKISVKKSVEYDLVNEDSLNDKLSVKNVELSETEVVVKGSADAINKIASIKALIDLKSDALKDVGTYELDDINVVAYNSKGEMLNNVEIIPSTLKASITLDTYSKTVPVKVLTTGTLLTGKAIASILVDNSPYRDVTIYGDQEQINSIDEVAVNVDVDGMGSSTKNYSATIKKQAGVRAISDKNLNITITFGDEKQKEIQVTTIRPETLSSGLTANIIGTESVPVIVKGVQSVIDNITESNIDAYIDLEGYTAGEYDVNVKINNSDPKLNFVVSSTVKVKITSNSD